jgi:hypothetical protein
MKMQDYVSADDRTGRSLNAKRASAVMVLKAIGKHRADPTCKWEPRCSKLTDIRLTFAEHAAKAPPREDDTELAQEIPLFLRHQAD